MPSPTGGPSWPDFLSRARARRRVPRRVDLVGVVERYRARPHTGRVGVVLDLDALPRLVGVRRLDAVPDVSAPAAELARQTGAALSLLVLPDRQAELLGTAAATAAGRRRGTAARRTAGAPRLGRGRRRPAAGAGCSALATLWWVTSTGCCRAGRSRPMTGQCWSSRWSCCCGR